MFDFKAFFQRKRREHKSVLNTDSFDKRKYREMLDISKRLQALEVDGKQELVTFPDLLGDTWSAFFKTDPKMSQSPEQEVLHHQPIMSNLLANADFQGLRQHTKLDEFMSALCTANMGEEIKKMVNNIEGGQKRKLKRDIRNAQDNFDEAKRMREEAEIKKDCAKNSQDTKQKKELLEQAKKLLASARRKENMGHKQAESAQKELTAYLKSDNGMKSLSGAIQAAGNEAKATAKQVDALLSGLGAGNQPGQPSSVPVTEKLKLAEVLAQNPKLQEIGNLTGRMLEITGKKKVKTMLTTQRNSVEYGAALERMVPVELMYLKHRRQDFLRRYAEGNIMQYAKEGKESLGKGPIVVCLDTSGSMKSRDHEAKAVALALLSLASKQKRPYAMINFSAASDQKSWVFSKAKDINTIDIIDMAGYFWNNGTAFRPPLNKAFQIIEKENRFKTADIVFITDGKASDVNSIDYATFREDMSRRKKKLGVQIIAVAVTGSDLTQLKQFADRIIETSALRDDRIVDDISTAVTK